MWLTVVVTRNFSASCLWHGTCTAFVQELRVDVELACSCHRMFGLVKRSAFISAVGEFVLSGLVLSVW